MRTPIALVLICSIPPTAFAQPIDRVELAEAMDAIFSPFDEDGSPGAALTVLQDGQVVAKQSYGTAHLEHDVPFTHRTPVRLIYSEGREFLAMGLALMEAEGLLRFDDRVRTYFPKLPEWSKDVTILDLLDHSSGFDDEWSLLLLMTADMRTKVEKEQVLRLLYDQPAPQIEPGQGYMYNNTDMALLRMIMERVCGQRLPDYLEQRLFRPLGMASTFMNDDIERIIPGLAEAYYGVGPVRKARFIKHSPGGDYRMVTTADDLEKWVAALADGSSPVAQGAARLHQVARPIPVLQGERHYTFGHVVRSINGTEVVLHGGVGDNFYITRIPARNVALICLGNGDAHAEAAMQLAYTLLPPASATTKPQRPFPAEQATPDRAECVRYAGRYFAQDVGYNSHIPPIRYLDLKPEGEVLMAYYGADTAGYPLTPFGNGHFKDMDDGTMMRFTPSETGTAMELELWMERMEPLTFLREENRTTFSRDYLHQFTGRYYSPHLDYFFRIVLSDEGHLLIERPTVPDTPMEPTSENRFLVEQKNGSYSTYIRLLFSRDRGNKVDGFTVQYSRMMHHRFEKVE